MTKTIAAALQTHLDGEVTTLCTLWQLTRVDGTIFRFTDCDRDIEFSGDTYKSAFSYTRTAIANNASLSVDNMDVVGILEDSNIALSELAGGLFDYAEIRIWAVNHQSVSDGDVKMRRGFLGEALMTEQGLFTAELRSLLQVLTQRIGEVTTSECRADLGDMRCKVPIDPDLRQDSTAYEVGDFIKVATTAGTGQAVYENRIYECTVAGTSAGSEPTFDTVVGNTTTDGTVTWTTREAWMRHAEVDVVSDQENFTITNLTESRAVDDWFNLGALQFESGNNSGLTIEISDWVNATSTITLRFPAPFTIANGDLVRLYPGCDKRRTTCRNKFVITGSTNFATGNVRNMRAEPDTPGRDRQARYPGAR